MAEENSATGHSGDWQYLWKELATRTSDPVGNVPFVFYVFLGIFLFGGLGIWAESLKLVISKDPADLSRLISAVNTFFPALIGSTTLQLIFASASKNDKVLIAFAQFVFCIFLTAAILLPFFSADYPIRVLGISAVCSICAVWFWWITNGSDPTYQMPTPDAAMGGETSRNPKGSLDGFAV